MYRSNYPLSAVAKKRHLHNMDEVEKEAVGFPVICHLVARLFTKEAAPYFYFIIYIIHLYKEDLYNFVNMLCLSGCSSPQNCTDSPEFWKYGNSRNGDSQEIWHYVRTCVCMYVCSQILMGMYVYMQACMYVMKVCRQT